MFRIPLDLDLSKAVGQFTTQICVGQFDLQFEIGEIHFAIWSPVRLVQQGAEVGSWAPDEWPHASFLEIFNIPIERYQIPNDRLIILHFQNGIEMHLGDPSDQYESMAISIPGSAGPWII